MRRLIVLCLTVCAGVVFVYTLAHSAIYNASDDTDLSVAPPLASIATTTAVIAPPSAEAGVPLRLRIPKIDVDTAVQQVGLGRTGNMAVPVSYTDVGWYRYGTIPGKVGSAVIDGHVNNGLGIPAVFARLGELAAGDDIYIDTKDGAALHFKVEDSATYAVADVPREKLFNRADEPRLNLITCEGVWLPDQKMYDSRHIVYAVLMP